MGEAVRLKTREQIKGIYKSAQICAQLIVEIENLVKPGISTLELDDFAYKFIKLHSAEPAFLGYQGFPATLCTSINDEIVHGIPSQDVILKEGDILKIDTGVILNGLYSDTAKTIVVGSVEVPEKVAKLLKVTESALYDGISMAKSGKSLVSVSDAIYSRIRGSGFKVIRELTGHGVGFSLHEPPVVHNYPTPEARSVTITDGLVIALEPMASISSEEVYLRKDNWTYCTVDGSISAHYEHTVAVLDGTALVLTKPFDEEAREVLE